MHWLDDKGIAYEPVDVIADESAFHEMITLSGQELAPVHFAIRIPAFHARSPTRESYSLPGRDSALRRGAKRMVGVI